MLLRTYIRHVCQFLPCFGCYEETNNDQVMLLNLQARHARFDGVHTAQFMSYTLVKQTFYSTKLCPSSVQNPIVDHTAIDDWPGGYLVCLAGKDS